MVRKQWRKLFSHSRQEEAVNFAVDTAKVWVLNQIFLNYDYAILNRGC